MTANVACAAAEAFIMSKANEKEGDAMVLAVAKYYDDIKLFAEGAKNTPPPKPDAPWMDFDEVKQRNKAKTAVAVKPEPAKLMPKVILYDATTGVPTNAQDVRAAQAQSTDIAVVPWKQWLGGRAAQTLPERRRTWRPS